MEVLVATGVVVAGAAALLQLFLMAVQATIEARDATYAAVLAAQKIEELRAASLPAPAAGTEYLNARGAQVQDRAMALYQRRWDVAPLPGQPGETMVVTVRVWRHGAAHRAMPLTTLRTRKGG